MSILDCRAIRKLIFPNILSIQVDAIHSEIQFIPEIRYFILHINTAFSKKDTYHTINIKQNVGQVTQISMRLYIILHYYRYTTIQLLFPLTVFYSPSCSMILLYPFRFWRRLDLIWIDLTYTSYLAQTLLHIRYCASRLICEPTPSLTGTTIS